jgi:hypothetical protein
MRAGTADRENAQDFSPGGANSAMPINQRYGQQAVQRGFINAQRLQQVLTKQRQLAEQGKKVSVRMILEKSKLLTAGQLATIDKDLNIKVVTKRTGGVAQQPPKPQIQAGTMYSPPPPDMQDRIRAERERARQESEARQSAAAGSFLDSDDEGFGDDPFAEEQGAELAPEPIGDEKPIQMYGEPASLDADLSPEPEGLSDDMSPEPFGFDDDGPVPQRPADGQPASLERSDSAPTLSSLGADQGLGGDDELPSVSPFDEEEQHPPAWGEAEPPKPEWGATEEDLAPADQPSDFADDGIRSPEELEAGAASGTKPIGGNLDKTMWSPPPPGFKEAAQAARKQSPEPEPEPDNWGEDSPFADDAHAPGPTGRQPGEKKSTGRQGADDFSEAEFPDSPGRRVDDLPTAPATGDSVHPLRRNVGTSSSSVSKRPAKRTDRVVKDFPDDIDDDMADDSSRTPSRPKLRGKGPGDSAKGKSDKAPKVKKKVKEKPAKMARDKDKGEKKGTARRVLLLFVILLLIVVAVLVLPVALYNDVPQVRAWRDNETFKPVYDYVEEIYSQLPWYTEPVRPEPDPGPILPTPEPAGETGENGQAAETPANGEAQAPQEPPAEPEPEGEAEPPQEPPTEPEPEGEAEPAETPEDGAAE